MSDLQSEQIMTTNVSNLQTNATVYMERINAIASTIPATVSTMTVLLVLNQPLDLNKVLEDFKSDDIQNFIYEVTGDSKSVYTESKRPFNNSLVFKCKGVPTNDGTVLDKQAVKVFCNGNVHITGVKKITDALYLGDVFATMLELVYGGDGISNMFTFTSFDVQLVNLYFQLDMPSKDKLFDLSKVKDLLTSTIPYFVCYNTERHAGVIIKAVEFTLLIFNSGNVIISSIKHPVQLEIVRDFIKNNIVNLPKQVALLDKPSAMTHNYIKRAKQDFDYSKYIILR